MYKPNEKHYILKQASGNEINIFHSQNEGICVRKMGINRVWNSFATVKHDGLNNFCAALDEKDQIHILCQTGYGEIVLLTDDNRQWMARTVLKDNGKNKYDKRPYLTKHKDKLFLFYRIKHNGRNFLSYQTVNRDHTVNKPIVADEMGPPEYYIIKDENNLTILYTRRSDSGVQPGIKQLRDTTAIREGFYPIEGIDPQARIKTGGYDSQNNMHTFWQLNKPDQIEILYKRYDASGHIWEDCIPIMEVEDPVQAASFFTREKQLFFCWICQNTIYFRMSIDEGRTWSEPDIYPFSRDYNFYCITYIANHEAEGGNVEKITVPGNFIHGYTLAFTDRIPEYKAVVTAQNEEEIWPGDIMDRLKMIENTVCHLDEKYGLFSEMITRIEKEIELHKAYLEQKEKEKSALEKERVLMPGTGFSNITPDFLERLNDRTTQ